MDRTDEAVTKYHREKALALALYTDLPQRAARQEIGDQARHAIQEAVSQLTSGFGVTNEMQEQIQQLPRPRTSIARDIDPQIRDEWLVGLFVLGAAEAFGDARKIEQVCRDVALTLRRAYVELDLTYEPIASGFTTTVERELQPTGSR